MADNKDRETGKPSDAPTPKPAPAPETPKGPPVRPLDDPQPPDPGHVDPPGKKP